MTNEHKPVPWAPALKYTPDACRVVIECAEEGMWPEEWCRELGITRRTMYNWIATHEEFRISAEKASDILAAVQAREVRQMFREGNPTLPSKLKLLARRIPTLWGEAPKETVDRIAGHDSDESAAQVQAEARAMKDADLEERIRKLEARRAADQGGKA